MPPVELPVPHQLSLMVLLDYLKIPIGAFEEHQVAIFAVETLKGHVERLDVPFSQHDGGCALQFPAKCCT